MHPGIPVNSDFTEMPYTETCPVSVLWANNAPRLKITIEFPKCMIKLLLFEPESY